MAATAAATGVGGIITARRTLGTILLQHMYIYISVYICISKSKSKCIYYSLSEDILSRRAMAATAAATGVGGIITAMRTLGKIL